VALFLFGGRCVGAGLQPGLFYFEAALNEVFKRVAFTPRLLLFFCDMS
jgi:hypothetical protein